MGTLDNVNQKVKSTVQQIKGSIEESNGHPVKGKLDKLRGKLNVAVADVKMKM